MATQFGGLDILRDPKMEATSPHDKKRHAKKSMSRNHRKLKHHNRKGKKIAKKVRRGLSA